MDVSGGLDFAFEFTLANTAPNYGDPTASGNDILHLTSSLPFSSALTLENTLNIYLSNAIIGDTYLGGFFTSLSSAELEAATKGADIKYFVRDGNGLTGNTGDIYFNGYFYRTLDPAFSIEMSGAEVSDAAFTTGTESGSTLKLDVVPEPSTCVMFLGGICVLAFGQKRRRQMAMRSHFPQTKA